MTCRISPPSPSMRAVSVSLIDADALGEAKRRDAAPPFEIGPQFAQEERVAARAVSQQRRRCSSLPQRQPAAQHDVLGDGVGVEPAQVEPANAIQAVQLRHPGCHLVGAIRCRAAKRHQHQHARAVRGVHHVLEQRDRRQLRPVEILKNQRQRAVVSQPAEQAGHGIEQVTADLT
jgi:hypothetical protein